MTQRSRQMKHVRRFKVIQWAITLAIGVSACAPALAMRGHARMLSAPGQPFQALVGLQDLTPDEAASLQVSVADQAAWQRAGLKPPAPLSSLMVQVEKGMNPASKNLRVWSTQAPASGAIDLVLNIRSSTGQRQIQVSILAPLSGSGVDVAPGAAGTPSRATGKAGSIQVKPGDTLFAIASRNTAPNTSVYQMMVALWRANPDAFIQNNMNLVRAGEKLVMPSAAVAREVAPAEARHLFSEHTAAFARYRARLGAVSGANPVLLKGQGAASGTVTPADDTGGAVASPPQDRVRLSSGQAQDGAAAAQADQADQRVSNARAMADAQERLNQLQSNIEALNKAVAEQGDSASQAESPVAPGAEDAASIQARPLPRTADTAGKTGTADTAGAGTADTAGTVGLSGTSGASEAATADSVSPPKPVQADPDAATDLNTDKNVISAIPAWLANNLLVIVTAVLALIAFVIAWMLRRAGARRGDDDEELYADEDAQLDEEALNRRLENVDFNLDQAPADEPDRARDSRM